MSTIQFNVNTLKIVNELSVINESIIFEKDDEKGRIFVDSSNQGEEIVYQFSAPMEHFNFEGKECSFNDFPEFIDLLTIYDKPSIEQKGADLRIWEKKSQIDYRLSDPEAIDDAFTSVEFEDPDTVFTFTGDQIKHINKMVNKLNGDVVNLSIANGEITFKVMSHKHKNTWSDLYKVDESTDETYNMNISSEIFSVIPDGDYVISIMQEGLVRFVLKTEDPDVNVTIYTGEEEEDI